MTTKRLDMIDHAQWQYGPTGAPLLLYRYVSDPQVRGRPVVRPSSEDASSPRRVLAAASAGGTGAATSMAARMPAKSRNGIGMARHSMQLLCFSG